MTPLFVARLTVCPWDSISISCVIKLKKENYIYINYVLDVLDMAWMEVIAILWKYILLKNILFSFSPQPLS